MNGRFGAWTAAAVCAIGVLATSAIGVNSGAAAVTARPSAPAATWRVMTTPNAGLELKGITCIAANSCFAVGVSNTASALVLHWNGATWTRQPTPKIAGSEDARLTSVSCTSAKWCEAVGYESPSKTPNQTFSIAERWNGTTWAVQATPPSSNPAFGVFDQLTGVACPATTECFATGASDDQSPLLLRWNGTAWSLASFPDPGDGQGGLRAVSCRATNWCEAVGFYFVDSEIGPMEPMAAHWNGSRWALDESPPRPLHGTAPSEFDGITCPTATDCLAVGSSTNDSTGAIGRVLEQWNGHAWSIVVTPAPAHISDSSFAATSCVSASSCVAVGWTDNPPGFVERELVDRWNGTAWTTDTTPGKGPLAAVACNAPTTCTAVGETTGGKPLAERTP
jgi:hypothetical protein